MIAENQVKLSSSTKKTLAEAIYQYGENDLTIVQWNSALVIEPGGSRDIPDILEFSRLFECNRELREWLSKTILA